MNDVTTLDDLAPAEYRLSTWHGECGSLFYVCAVYANPGGNDWEAIETYDDRAEALARVDALNATLTEATRCTTK